MGSKKQKKSKSVRMQGHDRLEQMFLRGSGTKRKKHQDKANKDFDALRDCIYSRETVKNYRRTWNRYCDLMRDDDFTVNGHKPRTMEEAVAFMPRYLEILSQTPGRFGNDHLSAWTVRNYFAGPGKVMGLSMSDYSLPSRLIENVQRSRGYRKNSNFNPENHRELIEFQRCIGARANKELEVMRGCDLRYVDGAPHIWIRGKGGLERVAPIIGSHAAVQRIVARMEAAGDNPVWGKMPEHYDCHADRAYYACKAYALIARPESELKGRDAYRCKGPRTGEVYDRSAMKTVTKYLGHSRESVIAESYMWRLEEVQDDIRYGRI